jgi:4-diphosphocytidyl-2-C-methyl-D-erythritol kinase
MISFPHSKINLGLQVVSKRPDGYHNLNTCFYPVKWTDIIEIIPAQEFAFTYSGNDIPGNPSDNLCVRAYGLLSKDFKLAPVKIHLHKNIPTGAGLGGGSSDAAFVLRLLNDIFHLALSVNELKKYAAALGSDCSFFIEDKPMLGTGRGEILLPLAINIKGKYILVVKPDIHVSTAEAYAGIIPQPPSYDLMEMLQLPVERWRDNLKNDFEGSVFAKYPKIEQIKNKLYGSGALYASMSGSGAAVFGIFSSQVDLKKDFPNCQYWSGFAEF